MVTVDSIGVEISASAKSANEELSRLSEQLEHIANGLSAIGKSSVLDAFTKKALETVKGFSGISNIAKNIEPQMQKAARSIEGITAKYKDLGKGFTFRGSAAAIQKQIDNYSNALERAKLKKQELEAGEKTGGQGYEDAIRDILKYENIIGNLKQQLAEMQAIQPQLNINISGLEEAGQSVSNMLEQIREVQLPKSAFNYDAGAMEAVFGEAAAKIQNYAQAVEVFGENAGIAMNEASQLTINTAGIEGATSALRRGMKETGGAAAQAANNISAIGRATEKAVFVGKSTLKDFNLTLSGVTSAAKKLASVIKNAFSKVSGLVKSFAALKSASKGINTSFAGGFKTFLRYGIGIESIFTLINKLRAAIKEGFKNLVQYSNETNASVSMLKNSLEQLKNASAAMAAPLFNALAPVLNQIIQLCIKAADAINQLISSILGKSTWIRAKKQINDYAAGINGTNKEAEKLYSTTLGIDELNINAGDAKNKAEGAGGQYGAADMFETVSVEEKFKDWADRLKSMWRNADFTELGALIGTKLKNALDSINWEPIKETAAKIGKSLATLINGFVEVEGLADSIGRTIGEAINTGIALVNRFLDNTHWGSVGKFIGDALNGIVESIDWPAIGHFFAEKWNAIFEIIGNAAVTFDWSCFGQNIAHSINTWIADFNWTENGAHLGELIKGLLDALISFIEETDWQALGNGVADFIGGIDWSGIVDRLFEGIGAALGGLWAFLQGLIEGAWNSVVGWWQETAYEDGKFTITGLLNGILEALKNIGAWIKEHIFQPFINGFNEAFGNGPSGAMNAMGGHVVSEFLNGASGARGRSRVIGTDLIEGAKEGIDEKWGSLKDKIWKVGESISEKFREATGTHSPSTVMKENGVYLIEGLEIGVSENVADVIELFNMLSFSIMEVLTALNENISLLTSQMTEMILAKQTQITGKTRINLTTLRTIVKQMLTFINADLLFSMTLANNNWSNKWNQIAQKTRSACQEIIGAVRGMASQVQSMCSSIIDAVNSAKAAAASLSGINVNVRTGVSVGIRQYATGGFPEDGWFRASKGEYFGHFDDGTSYIANNNQIEYGIAAGVEEAAYRGMMRALSEINGSGSAGDIIQLLVEQNEMLANGSVRAVMDSREALEDLQKANERHGHWFT